MSIKTKRNANLELLRVISMLMVVMVHALGKSDLLVVLTAQNMQVPNAWIAWVLEVLCAVSVNVFMLISGYFLVEADWKPLRILELVAEIMFYSIGGFLVCYACGLLTDITIYDFLKILFPIHMDVFWFMTAYLLLYVLQPILVKGVKSLEKKQLQFILILLLVYESIFKSILPIRFDADTQGYSVLWCMIVFLIGAYIRLYGFPCLKKPLHGVLLYLGCSMLNFVVLFMVQQVVTHMGHLEDIENYTLEYNHILVLLASVGLFAAFSLLTTKDSKCARIICTISPMALGVYLCHENMSLRYRWQSWLGLNGLLLEPTIVFVIRLLIAVLVVYIVGTVIDFIRIRFFLLCRRFFNNLIKSSK